MKREANLRVDVAEQASVSGRGCWAAAAKAVLGFRRRRARIAVVKTPLCLILLTTILVVSCSKPAQSPPPLTTNAPSALDTAFGAAGRAKQSAVKIVDTASLTKAIELFQVDKGRLPKDLNELVAGKYIPVIPDAPVGMKIVYDPTTGEVKVVPQ
jgi:hypothetical protein